MGKALIIKFLLTVLIFVALTVWVLYRLQNYGQDDDLLINPDGADAAQQSTGSGY